MSEATRLAAGGVRELNVIGQATTAYGAALPGQPTLADLLGRALDPDQLEQARALAVQVADRRARVGDVEHHGSDRRGPIAQLPVERLDGALGACEAAPGQAGDAYGLSRQLLFPWQVDVRDLEQRDVLVTGVEVTLQRADQTAQDGRA